MRNFPFIHKGNEYWYSRSVAAASAVVAEHNGVYHLLAVKRGNGARFHNHEWCIPGGFLDFNETVQQCAMRETFEETGISLSIEDSIAPLIIDDPSSSKEQTVTLIYFFKLDDLKPVTNEYSELDEVEEIKWIPFDQIFNYKWMYSEKLINTIYDFVYNASVL